MPVEPGDGTTAGRARMRAGRTDREHVVETLKTAFVQERLTKDELDARVSRALAARTYAELDAVTDDIPVAPALAPLPQVIPSVHRPRRSEVKRAVRFGAAALGVIMGAASTMAGVADGPVAAAVLAVIFVIFATASVGLVALIIRVGLMVDEQSRRRKYQRGRIPPSPGAGTNDTARRGTSWAPPHRRGGGQALASAL